MEKLLEFLSNREQRIQCQKGRYEMVDVRKLIDDALDFETAVEEEKRKSGDGVFSGSTIGTVIYQPHQSEIKQGDTTVNEPPETSSPEPKVTLPSAFRNGMFYLLVFEVVFFLIAIAAGYLPLPSLIVAVIATLLAFVLIGVFQLRSDDRLSEKTFGELVTLVIEQLPVLGGFFKQVSKLFGKG